MSWKHFSSHGTRHRDTWRENSASGKCTVHQLISARVHASADLGAMAMVNSTQQYALVLKFKNAPDLNDVKNRHLCLFLDQIGCDRSNDINDSTHADGRFLHCHRDSPCCLRPLSLLSSRLSSSPLVQTSGFES